MPHNRYFLDVLFNVGEKIELTGDEAHHLIRVMRNKAGDTAELVNGKNQLALAVITSIGKKEVILQINLLEASKALLFPLILCQAIPKLNRLENIVEKGTELGMTELWLFPGQLSEKKELSPTQMKRLHSISIAAMKQCGRLDLPKIEVMPPLSKWSSKNLIYSAYFGDLSPDAPKLSTIPLQQGVLFFVGPESGFTSNEENHLISLGAQGVRLHPNILRTDTASLTALSIIMNKI